MRYIFLTAKEQIFWMFDAKKRVEVQEYADGSGRKLLRIDNQMYELKPIPWDWELEESLGGKGKV